MRTLLGGGSPAALFPLSGLRFAGRSVQSTEVRGRVSSLVGYQSLSRFARARYRLLQQMTSDACAPISRCFGHRLAVRNSLVTRNDLQRVLTPSGLGVGHPPHASQIWLRDHLSRTVNWECLPLPWAGPFPAGEI